MSVDTHKNKHEDIYNDVNKLYKKKEESKDDDYVDKFNFWIYVGFITLGVLLLLTIILLFYSIFFKNTSSSSTTSIASESIPIPKNTSWFSSKPTISPPVPTTTENTSWFSPKPTVKPPIPITSENTSWFSPKPTISPPIPTTTENNVKTSLFTSVPKLAVSPPIPTTTENISWFSPKPTISPPVPSTTENNVKTSLFTSVPKLAVSPPIPTTTENISWFSPKPTISPPIPTTTENNVKLAVNTPLFTPVSKPIVSSIKSQASSSQSISIPNEKIISQEPEKNSWFATFFSKSKKTDLTTDVDILNKNTSIGFTKTNLSKIPDTSTDKNNSLFASFMSPLYNRKVDLPQMKHTGGSYNKILKRF